MCALVQYGGGVTDFRGSIAGNTFQRTTAGNIVRHRAPRPGRSTPRMATVQANTFDFLRQWRALTGTQQAAWSTFASANPRVDKFGVTKNLSGENMFITINSNLRLIGGTELTTPPANDLPATIDSMLWGPDPDDISLALTYTGAPEDCTLVIYTTPPIIGTTLSFRQHLRQTLVVQAESDQTVILTTEWETTHGLTWQPSNPFVARLGVAAYTVHNVSGLITPAQLAVETSTNP